MGPYGASGLDLRIQIHLFFSLDPTPIQSFLSHKIYLLQKSKKILIIFILMSNPNGQSCRDFNFFTVKNGTNYTIHSITPCIV